MDSPGYDGTRLCTRVAAYIPACRWRMQTAECVCGGMMAEKCTRIYGGRTVRCAKGRLFSTTGSHGSQGTECRTLQPLLVHQGFFFSLMLVTGPRVLNSAPHAVLN